MFHRDIVEKLRLWASSDTRKPLVLRGARQVGKPTAIELFAKEFDRYIYLNLEHKADREVFERGFRPMILLKLSFC